MNQPLRYLVLVLLSVAVVCAWLKPLDEMATRQADAGLKRAVTTFATARALNAVISVVQGTEFSVQPVGVGINLTPGQVLDPVNDLVEQFSSLMLVASVAFGAQVLLVKIGGHWIMSLLLTGLAAAWGWRYLRGPPPSALLTRLLMALLLVRFIVPVAGLASDGAYTLFMEPEYAASQKGIERSADFLGALEPADQTERPKWWDLRERLDKLKAAAEETVEHIIRLIVVFLLQTLVLPLLAFWILLRAGRMLTNFRPALADGGEGRPSPD